MKLYNLLETELLIDRNNNVKPVVKEIVNLFK